jgi:C-terminal processing protease CtpA/Prc
MVMPDGKEYRCRLMIDLGASHSILIATNNKEQLPVPARCIKTVVGRGLGGDIDGCIGRIATLQFDDYALKDITASFAENYRTNDTIDEQIIQGTIGGDILSRFNIIFDYSNDRVFIKKNYTFRRSFEYNLSGIQVIASGIDLKRFEVVSCIEDSPAARAGVRPGDILLGVNGSETKYLTLNQINRTLFSHPGRILWLKIFRNGEIIKAKFRLKRII